MAIKLHILNSAGTLDETEVKLTETFEKSVIDAKRLLKLDRVDIVVRNLPWNTIPEINIGGFTFWDGHTIEISLDVEKPISLEDLYLIYMHEMHHAKRFQVIGPPKNLADNLVSEGLATLIEFELSGDLPLWSKVAINSAQIALAQKNYFKEKYKHDDWFFGSEKLKLPRWFGYAYGFKLCRAFAEKHNKSAADLVGIPTKDIIF